MAGLRVPDRYKAGIVKLATLGQDAFEQLEIALAKAPDVQNVNELTAWIGDETPLLTDQERKRIINALEPMARVQRRADVTAKVFALDVWESVSEGYTGKIDLDEGQFRSRVEALVSKQALNLPGEKVKALRREVERSFCKARIYTDLRSAFRDEISAGPSAMALLHNLQLGFHDNDGEHHDFYVTLTSAELSSLKKGVERAEQKAALIEGSLANTGIKIQR